MESRLHHRGRWFGGLRDGCTPCSEDPSVTVLLIEAGGAGRDIFIRAPALVAAMVSGRPKIKQLGAFTPFRSRG